MLKYLNYLQARRLEKKKNWNGAANKYRRILADSSDSTGHRHYRLGFALAKTKAWKEAEQFLRIAVTANPKKAQWQFRLGMALERQKKWGQALAAYKLAVALDTNHADWHMRKGICLLHLKQWANAEAAFRSAIEHDHKVAEHYNRLAEALRKQGKWWQEIEALQSATALYDGHADWHYRLGEACEMMSRFSEAADAYTNAVNLNGNNANWHYRLGYVYERAGQPTKAQAAYADAIEHDESKRAVLFGIGLFHQQRGYWPLAAEAYHAQVQSCSLHGDLSVTAELYYRLGMARDRCYQWTEAANAYQQAIILNIEKPEWHYRLGFVFERMGDLHNAARAYAAAASKAGKHTPYWFYRLGYVLHSSGRFQEAAVAYLETQEQKTLDPTQRNENISITPENSANDWSKADGTSTDYLNRFRSQRTEVLHKALKHDTTHANWHYALGNEYERFERWEEAATAYRAAIARKDQYSPFWHYRLGYVLHKANQHEEACKALKEIRILKKPYGVPEDAYNEKATFKKVADYTEYFEDLPLQDNIVLYESFHGASVSCNPYAIFKHLLSRQEFEGWTHIWVVNDRSKIPAAYRNRSDVLFIGRNSDAYRRYLASAKVLINNVSFPEYFIRKPDQIYLNTWHGTPLKHLGKDIKDDFLAHKNVARNFLHATHIISPNSHTTDVLIDRYDVAGIYRGVVAETGYPRIDLILNTSAEIQDTLRNRLEIEGSKKVVLYAPTWRGAHGSAKFDTDRLVADISALQTSGCHVLFRGHHMVERLMADLPLRDCVVPSDIETNELLSIIDILVTDYSSIAFDFIATGKPIVYYAYDLEEYQRERGLYFSIEEMPGEKCYTREALQLAMERTIALSAPDATYLVAQRRFCPYDDGQVTRRVVDLVFFNQTKEVTLKANEIRKSLLFYGGPFMPNGILTSYLNLLNHIDPEKYLLTIAVDPDAVSAFPERLEQFSRLPKHVKVIGRLGQMNLTIEEKWMLGKFAAQHDFKSTEMWTVYKQAFEREYRRIFGQAHFDTLIHFEGYSRFWTALFASAPTVQETRKVIYQHNDMRGEWDLRFPYLEGNFRLYQWFDNLISVSRQTRDLNRQCLADKFDLDEAKFEYCDNLQNPELILKLAEESILSQDEIQLFKESSHTFVTMGRLSVEKDQTKLIRAFSLLHREHPDVRLLILGDGPMRVELTHLIRELKLDGHVRLLGQRLNPFPYLKKADCFILSSNHEGQPMVLFEAMILGKSIIATDIVGSRSVLEGRQGLLVPNNIDGLADGMRTFIQGKLDVATFNFQKYQADALHMFHEKVLAE